MGTKKTSDAVAILRQRYVGSDPKRRKALENARREVEKECREFERTGIDPYE